MSRNKCPECERSNGPHYRGPCEHGGEAPEFRLTQLDPAEDRHEAVRDLCRAVERYEQGRAPADDVIDCAREVARTQNEYQALMRARRVAAHA